MRRAHHHRKLTEGMLDRFRCEAGKRVALIRYSELAEDSGMALGSVQQLMKQLIREARGRPVVRRGTKQVDLEALAAQVRARL